MPSTRRTLLGTAAAALAGCLGERSDRSTEPPDATDATDAHPETTRRQTSEPSATATPRPLDPVEGTWPSFAFDAANTGYAPDGEGPEGQAERRWHAPVGTVFGAPVVAAGRVFAGGFQGGVVALDARTGETDWRQSLPSVSGSLAAAGESVFALTVSSSEGAGENDALHALAVDDGRHKWSYGSFSEAFGGLTVRDGVVYAPANEAVHAVDVETGRRVWKTEIPEGATHGPVAVDDGLVVVPTSGNDLYALDASTGERRWTEGFQRAHGRPTVAHGRVYVGTPRYHTEAYDTPTLRALDRSTGETEPVFATEGRGEPAVAATDDGLVVVDTVTYPPDRPATTPVTSPQITATPEEGETVQKSTPEPKPTRVYGLSPDGDERWSVELPARRALFGHPAVVDGTAYVGTVKGHLFALDAADGDVRWTAHTGDRYAGIRGPAVVDGAVFAGSDRGVFAFG